MIHPNHELVEPTTDPDYRTFSEEIWFKDGIYAWKRSDMHWEVCHLRVCPITGKPMYLAPNWPIGWSVLDKKDILEAFMRYTLEKELLGIDIFTESKNEDDKTRQEST